MPPLSIAALNDVATVWLCTGFDDHGMPVTPDPPIEIRCSRDLSMGEVVSPLGGMVPLMSTMFVGQVIPIGSLVYPGPMLQWYASGSTGVEDQDLMVVKAYAEQTDMKGRDKVRSVKLMRARDTK